MAPPAGTISGIRRTCCAHTVAVCQPCAALLTDLKQRGLLADTLVVFVTEFGRMPTFQAGANGRDHNPNGFTVWLAGGGVKSGFAHGATDEFGPLKASAATRSGSGTICGVKA